MSNEYVADATGSWVQLIEVPPTEQVAIASALAANRIEYRFAAGPVGTGGKAAPFVFVYVTKPDIARARAALPGYFSSRRAAPAAAPAAAAPAAAAGSTSRSEVTRHLCATAVLHQGTCKWILEYLGRRGYAVAPELGVDIPLVAQVATTMRRRERRYLALFCAVFLIAAILVLTRRVDMMIGAAVFVVLSAPAIGIRRAWKARWILTAPFRRSQFDPDEVRETFPDVPSRDVQASYPDPHQNLVVYRGFSPFVGAGVELGGWSLVVDTSKGAERIGGAAQPMPFTEAQLYDRILGAVRALELPNTEVTDMLFVSGQDIRDDRQILPDVFGPPVRRLPPDMARTLRAANDQRIRCYPWIRVHDWDGSLVTSQFLRFHRHRQHLFIELNRFVLTPLADGYTRIDEMPPLTFQSGLSTVISGAIAGVLSAVFYPFLALLWLEEEFLKKDRQEKERREAIRLNPRYDYGIAASMRESFTGGSYTRYFQKLDHTMHEKILEREILDTLVEFFDDHEIDAAELRDRRMVILNNGLIVNQGNVQATNLAVGANANASTQRRQTMRGATA